MASLEGQTIASTYKQLLKITSEGVGADASGKYVEDGLGTDTALSLSTTRVGIGTTSVSSDATFGVSGNIELKNAGDKYWIPRQSDGALTGSIYSRTGSNVTISGAGSSSGQIEFIPSSANSSAVAMTIDSSQNVGINYTTPSSMEASANNLVIGSGASGDNTGLTIFSNSDSSGSIHFADGTSGDAAYRGIISYNQTSDYMRFFTAGSEVVRIDSSGNVGIGTTSPQTVGGGRTLTIAGDAPEITLVDNASGTPYAWIATNDYGSLILSADRANEAGSTYMRMDVDGTERMRITSGGNVGIGDTSPTSDSGYGTPVLSVKGSTSPAVVIKNSTSGGEGLMSTPNAAGLQFAMAGNATASDNSIRFRTGNTNSNYNSTERMRITSDGKVGIQTSDTSGDLNLAGSFAAPLHILQKSSSQAYGLVVQGNSNANGARLGIAEADSNLSTRANTLEFGFDSSTDFIYSRTGKDFIFGVNSAERMRITSAGRVGIGETSPDEELHISANQASPTCLKIEAKATGERADINLYGIKTDNGGFAEILFVNNGDSTGAISCERENANDAGAIVFTTQATGAGMVEKMRITSAGHIIAPNLNQTGTTNNRYPLYWVHNGTNGSIEPYTGSVRAMKTDIADMGSVNWIHSLTPRSFKFRDFEDTDDGRVYLDTTNDNPNTEYGLIAEEVDEVEGSDYIVDKDSDGNVKGVLYHNLVPVLLKAVQELSAKVEALENA